jgi:collagenase-like PrtC family protease
MRFAVGYAHHEGAGESLVDIVRDYREHIAEVYFPWVGAASGRASLGTQRGLTDWTAQRRLEDDLRAFRTMGVKLDLLFNANCYGARAVSQALENEVGGILTHLEDTVGGVDIVTTTSPFVAHVIRTHFPDTEIRASVNMRIGAVEAMAYVADLFDSYYLQRDMQRNTTYVRDVKSWCDSHGKGLCLLANSGCLPNCPAQTFHDNMVAHDGEIDERKNVGGWTPHLCWRLFGDRANWPAILQATWIRPEDVHHYEGLCSVMKLATRMHEKPRIVVDAYTRGHYDGNLLDLLEPGLGPRFAPHVVLNSRFPDDWFERTSTCERRCHACAYCAGVFERVLIETD